MLDSNTLRRVLFEDIGLSPDTGFAIAYSGGCDSHVLLHAMAGMRQGDSNHADLKLTALHFDHNLMPQSHEWARQCEAVCREWNIEFISARQTQRKPHGESLEAFARQSRYRWFEQVVEPGHVLLTAHHANDQVETVLLNLLRGGGVELLAGIPQQRPLSDKKSTQVIRPLLSFPREVLADYAQQHALSWIEDPSNESDEFDRNYIRHAIMPLLQQRWRGAIRSLGNSASSCREVATFLNEINEELLQQCQVAEKRGVFCVAPPLDANALKPLGRFQIMNLIRYWVHQHGHRSPSFGQLTTLYEQVFEAHGERASLRWGHVQLRYFDEHLYLTRQIDDAPTAAVDWDLRECDLGKNQIRVEVHKEPTSQCSVDPQRLRGKSIALAWRKGGERMTLPGRKHSSELKKLFQQNAVPPWERSALPLLLVDGEVAWAHGVGASAACCCAAGNAGISVRFSVAGD